MKTADFTYTRQEEYTLYTEMIEKLETILQELPTTHYYGDEGDQLRQALTALRGLQFDLCRFAPVQKENE